MKVNNQIMRSEDLPPELRDWIIWRGSLDKLLCCSEGCSEHSDLHQTDASQAEDCEKQDSVSAISKTEHFGINFKRHKRRKLGTAHCPATSPLWSIAVATSPCRGAFRWDRDTVQAWVKAEWVAGEILIHRGGLETALRAWMFLTGPARTNIFFCHSGVRSVSWWENICNLKKKS